MLHTNGQTNKQTDKQTNKPWQKHNLLGGDKVALKVLDKTKLDIQAQRLLSREISSMEALQHPNVVRLYEVVDTPSRLYLVVEYAGGGDLHNRICNEGKLCDNTCKITFAQILHNMNIIHRDLKGENILFTTSGCVKVADLGFSTRVSNRNDRLDTFCGSPPYAAPELFRDECYLGPPVDVWAMGVLLFFMVTGTMPFRAETMGKLRRCIMEGQYSVPPWVPGPCQRLIKGILKQVPTERCAVDQMLGCDWLLPVEFPWSLTLHPPCLQCCHSHWCMNAYECSVVVGGAVGADWQPCFCQSAAGQLWIQM
uniref:non-specific serine/threonine protein kinase n=1 Tax=Sphaeramia orbicularis TaxID=375764 RepID=A0A673AQ56_9TELE